MFSDFDADHLADAKRQLQDILNSADGKQLMQLLRQVDTGTLQRAAEAAKSGDYEAAKRTLEPALSASGAAQLAQKLKQKQA